MTFLSTVGQLKNGGSSSRTSPDGESLQKHQNPKTVPLRIRIRPIETRNGMSEEWKPDWEVKPRSAGLNGCEEAGKTVWLEPLCFAVPKMQVIPMLKWKSLCCRRSFRLSPSISSEVAEENLSLWNEWWAPILRQVIWITCTCIVLYSCKFYLTQHI